MSKGDPILLAGQIKDLLHQSIHDLGSYGAQKIARLLCYSESAVWMMVSNPKRQVSREMADYLGYQKTTIYVRNDLFQNPAELQRFIQGKGNQ